jgi:zinc transporter, ZIP family
VNAVGLGAIVAASLLVGALAAARLRLPPRAAALVSAFGGGILLAAVAFELLPEADERAGTFWTAAGLLAGTALYVGADGLLTADEHSEEMRRSGHAAAAGQRMTMTPRAAEVARGEAIAAGIVVDGIPESLALGLMAVEGQTGLALLAAVVVGNVTESYGAAQPILAGGRSRRFAVGLLLAIGLLLGAVTVFGGTAGGGIGPGIVGTAEAVAAGAVLAVLAISIIPYAFAEVSSTVAVASALGFTGGYLLG